MTASKVTTTPPPKALRLALSLRNGTYLLSQERDVTADELERQHERITALLKKMQGGKT